MIAVTIKDTPFHDGKALGEFAPGTRLDEIVGAMVRKVGVETLAHLPDYSVSVGGWEIPPENWRRIKPYAPVSIVLRPQGGFVKSLLLAVAAIAITVVAPYAGAAIAGAAGFTGATAASIAGGVFALGASLAANLVLNALFPPPKQPAAREADQAYQIGGARNQADPNGPIPMVLGFVRIAPRYMATPITYAAGGDQFVRMAFCHGFANIELSDHRFGEAPVGQYRDLEQEHFETFDGTGQSLFPRNVEQEALAIELNDIPFGEEGVRGGGTRRTAADCTAAILDFFAPRGIFALSKKSGNYLNGNAVLEISYRKVGDAEFTIYPSARADNLHLVPGEEENPVFRSVRVIFPEPGTYDVRIQRKAPITPKTDKLDYFSDLTWTNLKSFTGEAAFKPGKDIAASFFVVRGTGQLSGPIDTYNCMAKSRCKSWTGVFWKDDEKTNNPADLFRYVLQCPANLKAVSDDELDLPSIQRWAEYCAAKGWTFNQYRAFTSSVDDVLRDICAAGRAVPIWIDGKRGVAFDEETGPIVQHFTPANTRGLESSRSYPDKIHAVRVRFLDEGNDFAEDIRVVYNDGYTGLNANPKNIIELRFPGVTNRRNAFKFARYYMAETELRPETYTFSTDAEALVARVGDRVLLAHDVTLHGIASGRIKFIAGNVITLDQEVSLAPGVTYGVVIRSNDGGSRRFTVTSPDGAHESLAVDGALDAVEPGDLYSFGELARETATMRVKEIKWSRDFRAVVTLVDEAPDIYRADREDIPEFEPNITLPQSKVRRHRPSDLKAEERLVLDGDKVVPRVRLMWTPPPVFPIGAYLIERRRAEGNWYVAARTGGDAAFYEVRNIREGTHFFRVTAITGDTGHHTSPAEISLSVVGVLAPPADVTGFSAFGAGDAARLTWNAVGGVNFSHYVVRHSPAKVGATWESATVIGDRVTGETVNVPLLSGSFMIKAVSRHGVESNLPGFVISGLADFRDLNVVETMQEAPGFAGERTNVVALDGKLRLDAAKSIFDHALYDEPLFDTPRVEEGFYDFAEIVDLGARHVSRVIADLSVIASRGDNNLFDRAIYDEPLFSTSGGWNAVAQVSTTDDDPEGAPVWSEWADAAAGEYGAGALRFRLRLTSDDGEVGPVVLGAGVTVDMPDRIVSEGGVQSTVGGVQITYPGGAFMDVPALQITVQDGDGSEKIEITNPTASGVFIRILSGGAPTDRRFDYLAKGYGRAALAA